MKPTLLLCLFATASLAAPAAPREPMPTEAQCQALGAPLSPLPFGPGETLDYDVDGLGVKAGTMVIRTLPARPGGTWPIEIDVATNTFFSKIRKVEGTATSFINPKTARTTRYLEDATEDAQHHVFDVAFRPHLANMSATWDTKGEAPKAATLALHTGNDVTDVGSAVYLLRSLPLREGQRLCVDVYAIGRMWRVWGTVLPREHVSLPMGEFTAIHVAGQAALVDLPDARREVHIWVSDDARRLPLTALGTIDLGTVRATLKGAARPGEQAQHAEPATNLTW